MSNSSSDNVSESKSPRPVSHDETSDTEEQSEYYYDDSTGYETYADEDDDDDDDEGNANESQRQNHDA